MDLEISGQSTALYSTFWMVEPYGILFDCGDGAASFLLQKGRSIRMIICSHPDRDHLAGLLQFLQLNSYPGGPVVYYPEGCGSFPALRDFIAKFDSHAGGCEWRPIRHGDRIQIRKNCFVECYRNQHFPQGPEDLARSLSFSLVEQRRKLKPELKDLAGEEIARLRGEVGEEGISEVIDETQLTYTADTPAEPPAFWRDPRILIHEATFLSREEATSRDEQPQHSVLDDVLKMASQMENLEALIVGHFSTRYERSEIESALRQGIREHGLQIPVYPVFPGEARHHVLGGDRFQAPGRG